MRNAVRRSSPIAVPVLLLALMCGCGLAYAQSGSAGGSIGNDEKSLSGSRAPPRPAESPRRNPRDADEARPAGRKGGGGNNFDGAWLVRSRGVTCQGTGSNAVVVTSGKIIGGNARGTVSPDGRVHATTNDSGITVITTGKLSGRSGGGTFRQSDGCTGTWTASKQ